MECTILLTNEYITFIILQLIKIPDTMAKTPLLVSTQINTIKHANPTCKRYCITKRVNKLQKDPITKWLPQNIFTAIMIAIANKINAIMISIATATIFVITN